MGYGVVFGWDIKQSDVDYITLRTNLRYTPEFNFKSGGYKFTSERIEFNFIQIVYYPERHKMRQGTPKTTQKPNWSLSRSGLPRRESKCKFNTNTEVARATPTARRGNFAAPRRVRGAPRHFAASRLEPAGAIFCIFTLNIHTL